MASRTLYYPKIPDTRDFPLAKCIAFEKYDGTNLHFRWDRYHGWIAFGTRRDEFTLDAEGIHDFTYLFSVPVRVWGAGRERGRGGFG